MPRGLGNSFIPGGVPEGYDRAPGREMLLRRQGRCFGDSGTDQRTGDAAQGSSRDRAGQRGGDRPDREQRPEAGNHQQAQTGEQPSRPAGEHRNTGAHFPADIDVMIERGVLPTVTLGF